MPESIPTSHSSDFFVYSIDGELTTPLVQVSMNASEQQKSSIIYTNTSNGHRIGMLSANYLLEVSRTSDIFCPICD